MKAKYSLEEVKNILIGVQMYAEKEGLKKVHGINYGEKAIKIIQSFDDGVAITEAIKKFDRLL